MGCMDGWRERGKDKKGVGGRESEKEAYYYPPGGVTVYTRVYIHIYINDAGGKFVVEVWKIKYGLFEVMIII